MAAFLHDELVAPGAEGRADKRPAATRSPASAPFGVNRAQIFNITTKVFAFQVPPVYHARNREEPAAAGGSRVMHDRPSVVVLYNPAKPDAKATTASLVETLGPKATVLATGPITDVLACVKGNPVRILVLGGDGSLLSVARSTAHLGIPLVGVNFGKLGFLAEFSLDDVAQYLDAVLTDPAIVSSRMMMEVTITRPDGCSVRSLAVNDCVVNTGPPFRMIELSITIDGHFLTDVSGDGLILATPCGSTAHNMSVGGPIVHSGVQALIMTPIAPHSLTHRPLVMSGESSIEVLARQANAGTTVVIDGQAMFPLGIGDRLVVHRADVAFQLVCHPTQHRWHTLTRKLKWGQ